MKALNVLGIDIGASNGRGIIGRFDGNRLVLEEVHRFPNRPVTVLSSFYWDILNLYNEVKASINKANSSGYSVASIGVDTWSQDFALLDSQGNMLGNPHHYRDNRTAGVFDEASKICSEYEIFSLTGLPPASICTLYQILSMKNREKSLLDSASTLLFIPDLINYFLTGNINCNNTLASVSLLYSPFTKTWSDEIIKKYKIPSILPRITSSGLKVGNVIENTSSELGIGQTPVISVAAHDTASAISSIQGDTGDTVFISCGTWSVLGTTLEKPLVNRDVFERNFCNEAGYNNKNIFVKNITGLWVLQECISEWINEGYSVDYDYLNESAENSNSNSFVDLDYNEFSQPGGMTAKIQRYCKLTGQSLPESREEIYRCIVLSLALKYRYMVDELEMLTGRKYKNIHIIGGGARNKFLCRATSGLTDRELYAGPFEASAIGNIVVQLIALGEIANSNEAEKIIRDSFPLNIYYPDKLNDLNAIYSNYVNAINVFRLNQGKV